MRLKALLLFSLFYCNISAAQQDSVTIIVFDVNSDETLGKMKSDTTLGYYDFGRLDAKEHYQSYWKASSWTLALGTCLILASPVAGLTSAIACSSTTPKTKNLDLPRPDLAQNEAYLAGYKWQAKKIKQRKVWKNWAIGFGINTTILSLFLLAPRK